MPGSGEIPEQVFEALRDEYIVIADLTGANPNVMYELGYRHVTGLCTIQIGEVGRLPFDISTIRTIQFKRSPAGLVAARNKLVTAIGHSLAHGCPPTTAGRIMRLRETRLDGATFDAQAQAESVVVSEEPSNDDALGILEAAVEIEEGGPDLSRRLGELTEMIGSVGEVTRNHPAKVSEARTPAHKLGRTAAYARELEPLARRFDEAVIEMGARISCAQRCCGRSSGSLGARSSVGRRCRNP